MLNNAILVLNNHGLGDVVMSFNFFENFLTNDISSNILVLFKSDLEKELFILTRLYQNNKKRFNLFSMKEVKKLFLYIFRIKKAYSLGVNESKSINLFKVLGIKNYYLAHPYEYSLCDKKNTLCNEYKIHKSILYSNLLKISHGIKPLISHKDYFLESKFDNDLKNYIVLSGGSGELEKHKRWPSSSYRQLVEIIINNTEFNIAFVGSSGEQQIVDEILKDIKDNFFERIVQLNGKTNLIELIEVLRKSELVIGNDNGVMHIASACDAKVLGLFGSTDYSITGPVGNHVNIIDNRIECAPCYAKDGNIEGCKDNVCMKNISFEEVFVKVKEIINK